MIVKYAFMSFSTTELTLSEVLAVAKRYGYDGVEPRLDANHKHGVEVSASPEQRSAMRKRVKDSGIAMACLATSLRYVDPAVTEEVLEQTRARIDLAGDLGVPCMRVFGGKIAEGVSREQAVDLVAESLGRVADHAAERGVVLCMETHDDWCNPADVAAVMQRAHHPAIAVNWDVMHPVRMKFATIEESFAALQPWIRHLHVHDGVSTNGLVLKPIGEGEVDHRRAVGLLTSAHYDGYLSGEWIQWEDPYDLHLPRELATLKRYEQELR